MTKIEDIKARYPLAWALFLEVAKDNNLVIHDSSEPIWSQPWRFFLAGICINRKAT